MTKESGNGIFYKIFSLTGELVARIPKNGNLKKILHAFGYDEGNVRIEVCKGNLRSVGKSVDKQT